MRQVIHSAFVFVLSAVAASGPTFADPWDVTIFVPAQVGASAHTLNLETREIQRVLEPVRGQRPSFCPLDAYWALNPERIASCDDGTVFELRNTTKVGILGALALVPAS